MEIEYFPELEMGQINHDYYFNNNKPWIMENVDVYDHVTKQHVINLAIIAAARNKCNYLVSLHEKEFLAEGGDTKWLNGLEFIPQKLRAIYDINKILAHRPWLLTKEHIERLTKGTNKSPTIEPEPEIKPSTTPPFIQRLKLEQQRMHQMMKEQEEQSKKVLQQNNSNGTSSDNIEMLMKRMQDLSEKKKECSETELSNRFKNVELQAAQLTKSTESLNAVEVPQSISHYVEDPTYAYQDFARHDKFRVAYNLTYKTLAGRQNVDTSKFRRAIWNYIQCIYGIRHDDYDYGEINQLLDRTLNSFIKTACCFPERITKQDYDNVLVELLDSEKVHVNLMIMEAKNQAILLYALREIMRYML
ncbi:hypothetical protein PVAND_007479 [Polypedilum vanderplanki]|uniref:Sestrin-like protein n=1 Tax=Polypedilum vanderplanki TaxID=319348 RepID=A0A9J6C6F2_POLVA|nr:hypothetical protein PVAND_007479 [Polypedilum vanderplanki]